MSNAFSVGHPTVQRVIVPQEDVLWGTPLPMVQYEQNTNTFGNVSFLIVLFPVTQV